MRVACFFTGCSRFGGAERRIGRIMNGVAAHGIEVVFVLILSEPLEKVKAAYVKAIGEDTPIRFEGFHTVREIFEYMRKECFDVAFYIGAYRKMLPFFVGAKLSGSRTVLLQVSTGPSVGKFGSFFEKAEFALVASNSNHIDCLYPSTTSYFTKKYKRQIVSTTPCPATDLKRFVPQKKEKLIAFISRWVKGKNTELLVESVLKIEEELFQSGYRVYLCGSSDDGSVEKRVTAMIEQAKHPEVISMPGYVNAEDILPKAEIFMSLQDINNYPSQSLLEAIACGCYIVASDEGDTRLLVKPAFGSCCMLDAGTIAQEILRFIKKPSSEKSEIISAAREFAESHFDIQASVQHYIDMVYNSDR